MRQASGARDRLPELLRFPYRRYVLDSELSPATVLARLRGMVEPGRLWLANFHALFRESRRPFAGRVWDNGFKILRITGSPRADAMLPVILGTIQSGPSHTRIRIVMRPSLQTAMIFSFWLAVVAVFLLVAVGGKSAPGLMPHFPGLYGVLFFGALYAFFSIPFNREAERAQGLLEGALRAK